MGRGSICLFSILLPYLVHDHRRRLAVEVSKSLSDRVPAIRHLPLLSVGSPIVAQTRSLLDFGVIMPAGQLLNGAALILPPINRIHIAAVGDSIIDCSTRCGIYSHWILGVAALGQKSDNRSGNA